MDLNFEREKIDNKPVAKYLNCNGILQNTNHVMKKKVHACVYQCNWEFACKKIMPFYIYMQFKVYIT